MTRPLKFRDLRHTVLLASFDVHTPARARQTLTVRLAEKPDGFVVHNVVVTAEPIGKKPRDWKRRTRRLAVSVHERDEAFLAGPADLLAQKERIPVLRDGKQAIDEDGELMWYYPRNISTPLLLRKPEVQLHVRGKLDALVRVTLNGIA